GQKCFDVLHANICQTACVLEKTLKTGKEIIDLPIIVINSEGKTIPVSISTAVLKDKKGEIIGGVETFRDLSSIEELKKEISKRYTFEDIISKNHEIQKIFDVLPDIAESDSTVLIQGASGSGKELFARAIHNLSHRKEKPYIIVNCGALPDTLLESELFGYVKGAFTDAKEDKPGRFALAEKGTLFLDEIAELSTALQVKLLRVLQQKEYEPLGATFPIKANVRIIAATNQELQQLLARGTFREDLYYRLNVVKIELPPLSERREDIPLLVDHFINQFNLKKGKKIIGMPHHVLNVLMKYEFPGNVRELENIIEHAFVLCHSSQIEIEHLPKEFIEKFAEDKTSKKKSAGRIKEAENNLIIDALKKHAGNRSKAAEELGIDKSTLWRKIKKYNIKDI
ncbi:MAG: sigma 54-interacting transcriptional regulator, partial [Deltaproteobacteria bacterium]|nr:sigma 54-interacting transcriptional regulator [Deltaproteobacteria bacterium]